MINTADNIFQTDMFAANLSSIFNPILGLRQFILIHSRAIVRYFDDYLVVFQYNLNRDLPLEFIRFTGQKTVKQSIFNQRLDNALELSAA